MYANNDVQCILKMIIFLPFLCKTVVDIRIKTSFVFNEHERDWKKAVG